MLNALAVLAVMRKYKNSALKHLCHAGHSQGVSDMPEPIIGNGTETGSTRASPFLPCQPRRASLIIAAEIAHSYVSFIDESVPTLDQVVRVCSEALSTDQPQRIRASPLQKVSNALTLSVVDLDTVGVFLCVTRYVSRARTHRSKPCEGRLLKRSFPITSMGLRVLSTMHVHMLVCIWPCANFCLLAAGARALHGQHLGVQRF